jgi:uncharacterized protein
MEIEFDRKKSERNLRDRGLSFDIVSDFDWRTAVVTEDLRFPYPERRFQAIGTIGGVLHMILYTNIQSGIRVISLRRASRQEKEKI